MHLLAARKWTGAVLQAWQMTKDLAVLDAGYDDEWAEALALESGFKERRSQALTVADVLMLSNHVDHALAWLMLASDPDDDVSVFRWLPQVQYAVMRHLQNEKTRLHEHQFYLDMLTGWHKTAVVGIEREDGEDERDVFRVIYAAVKKARPDHEEPPVAAAWRSIAKRDAERAAAKDALPGLVVMPRATATKLNSYQSSFIDVLGVRLPLTVTPPLAAVRRTLLAEYPHAENAIDLVLRDLVEGNPTYVKPLLLLGPPGSGKSRLSRRIVELTKGAAYRFDAAAASDSMFGGAPKAWGNTQPSVPARAVAQYKVANPWILVDEIEKAATSMHNGNLWSALAPFLERETARRYRDVSLDAELDLSMVSFVATANDVTLLPPFLRDRFRIVKVPAPGVQHLAALSASVIAQIAEEEGIDPAFLPPLDGDELDVIERMFARGEPSVRKLQKMVRATLDARQQFARRH